jgi:hypothetical protein
MALELEIEFGLSFGNPYAISFLCEARRRGKPVFLLSDTYFPSSFIARLLAKAGVPDPAIDRILASNEQDASKAAGDLFHRFRAMLPGEARILHIGDDLVGDVIQAARAGIDGRRFAPMVPPPDTAVREALCRVEEQPDPTASLRGLGRAVLGGGSEAEAFFFAFGATRLGPAIATFCAWLVRDAARRGIRKICPLMRDGAIFARLMRLDPAAEGIEIDELYLSRRAAFLPRMGRLDAAALAHFRSRRSFALADLVAELGLPRPPDAVIPLLGQPLQSLAIEGEIEAYLAAPDTQAAAARASDEARASLLAYLARLFGDSEAVALVDFGAAGNSMAWIGECLGAAAPSFVNYLFYAAPELMGNFAKGHLYAVFAGSDPEVARASRLILRSPEIFELPLTGLFETTIGYRHPAGGEAGPVTYRPIVDAEQDRRLQACLRGIDHAGAHLRQILAQVPEEAVLSPQTRRAIVLDLARVVDLPTADEARYLGDLLFDDNAGTDHVARICSPEDDEHLARVGAEAFLATARSRWGYHAMGVRWPQGVLTRHRTGALVEIHRKLFNDMDYRFFADDLFERVAAAGRRTVTLYGGGRIGFEMLDHARRRGLDVDFVVDSNEALHGTSLSGHRIVPLATAASEGCQAYLVASVAFARAIVDTIEAHYRARKLAAPTIFSLLNT